MRKERRENCEKRRSAEIAERFHYFGFQGTRNLSEEIQTRSLYQVYNLLLVK